MIGCNEFYLNGQESLDYGIIITKAPPTVFAEREVETIRVEGLSGDLIRDTGRYKNVSIPYECAILPAPGQSMRDAALRAVAFLRPSAIYRKLSNTYHPEAYRMGRISSQISVDGIVEQAGEFTLTFDCKPQRYLVSGETTIFFSVAGALRNPTAEMAKPLITVYGTGPGTLTVGGIAVELKAITDSLVLDCETQNAYRQVGDGVPENKNGDIYAPEFPELLPGSNLVSWTGGITKVEIIPRWWTL